MITPIDFKKLNVEEIKQMHLENNWLPSLKQWNEHIASIYGVGKQCIADIRLGRRWTTKSK